MCRLFGLSSGSAPVTATFWLLQAPDALVQQSKQNPDGTGLGCFDEQGRPHVYKQPLPAYEDRKFAEEAKTVRSATFVAHVRFASSGSIELKNTHPFEQHGRLFAHNGVVEDMPSLEQHLGDAMDLVEGDTDSERFFALISTEIDNHGGDVEAGIVAAASWVAENLPILSLNFVLIAAENLWAFRYPDVHELYVLEREAGEPIEQVSSHGTRIHSERGADHETVVVASEIIDKDPGWRLLSSGELVHVGPDLKTQSRVVIDQPPAHQLRLEDLEARARASQGG